MKILHTSDWHLGKRLGRYDRTEEFAAVLAEVEGIADRPRRRPGRRVGRRVGPPHPPDGRAHDGPGIDAADRGTAPGRRRRGQPRLPRVVRGARPAGAPAQRVPRGHREAAVRGRASSVPRSWASPPSWPRSPSCAKARSSTSCWRPARGTAPTRSGWRRSPPRTTRPWWRARAPDAVPILMAHFLVSGVKLDRSSPRGERELHMGDAYAATSQAIPAGPQYVAMGHIHAPQRVPGAPVPAEYAGSLLPLDFGEAGEIKRVVVVDVEPGRLATIESVPLVGGRPLRARDGDVGRHRGARARAGGRVPRPHGAHDGHGHDPRRAGARARSPTW